MLITINKEKVLKGIDQVIAFHENLLTEQEECESIISQLQVLETTIRNSNIVVNLKEKVITFKIDNNLYIDKGGYSALREENIDIVEYNNEANTISLKNLWPFYNDSEEEVRNLTLYSINYAIRKYKYYKAKFKEEYKHKYGILKNHKIKDIISALIEIKSNIINNSNIDYIGGIQAIGFDVDYDKIDYYLTAVDTLSSVGLTYTEYGLNTIALMSSFVYYN